MNEQKNMWNFAAIPVKPQAVLGIKTPAWPVCLCCLDTLRTSDFYNMPESIIMLSIFLRLKSEECKSTNGESYL